MTSPDPVTTKWVPIWNAGDSASASTPVPTVVNGQWLKGVGGAAVWSPLNPAEIDTATGGGRLGTSCPVISDWNSALTNGWYTGLSAANGPGGNSANGAPGWLVGQVVDHNPSWPHQEVWAFTEAPPQRRWRRVCLNGGWQPWQLLDCPWSNINAFSGFAAGIGDYDTSHWGPSRVCKRNGMVICEGLITVPSLPAGYPAWTLPVDYRPLASRGVIFLTANSSGGGALETWRVDGSGQVTCSTGPISWVTLSGVTFYADG